MKRNRRAKSWRLRTIQWLAGLRLPNLLAALALLVPLGTLGYIVIEGLSPIDAAYQTLVTLTTVGYTDLTTSEAGKLFGILFMAVGVGVSVVTLSLLAATLVEGRLREVIGRQKMEREIAELKDHVIVCGFGRFGQMTAEELGRGGVKFAVIDTESDLIAMAESRGLPGLHADATEEETLTRAGIERAKSVISTLPSDAANVYVALTAKSMRPGVQVVTLARDARAEAKLRAAGADYVVSPYTIASLSMARRILRPHVAAYQDTVRRRGSHDSKVQMGELTVLQGSPLVGMALSGTQLRSRFGITVVAIAQAGSDSVLYNPSADVELSAGDVLVCVGSSESLLSAARECAASSD